MSGFQGMDPEQMRAHAERLRSASGSIENLKSRLDGAVQAVRWEGRDAEGFRSAWSDGTAERLRAVSHELTALGEQAGAESEQQDAASAPDAAPGPAPAPARDSAPAGGAGDETGPGRQSTNPAADASAALSGYLHENAPWLPDWLERPLEQAASTLAGQVSDGIGWAVGTGVDLLESGLGQLGARTDGIAQLQRDAEHLGTLLADWATGERAPTIAEVGAAGLVAAGSAGVGAYEVLTGKDSPLLDDRPGGIVASVEVDDSPGAGPRTLQDLVLANDDLRVPGNEGRRPLETGRIGIQQLRADDGEAVYIVQIPPTEGASITDVPEAYGEQGNSRDWASNLRLVAGQRTAAMDDVTAAMEAADVPPGSRVLLVGHSQGGIIAGRLAADPGFNSPSGAAGTYDVTHVLTVGSPVQTVLPAQASTEVVDVHHGFAIDEQGISGDLVPALDLGGAQIGGGALSAPNLHEVTLPGYPVSSLDPLEVLAANHDSTGPGDDPSGGYAGSLDRAIGSDPVLTALQEELTGTYLGEGAVLNRSTVVTAGRGAP